ncbi:hypothetical protein AALM74_10615 [Parabacteroides segnis]|uniref:hypothetical protein n=1 Tax=Parabacteroides segnis TaxID=2763058 RepID=UPI0035121303
MKYCNSYTIPVLFSFLFVLLACRDEMPYGNGGPLVVEEGIPGMLTLAVGSVEGASHVVTRATAEEEKNISSLYVFVINVTSDDSPSSNPILSKKWFPDTESMKSNGQLKIRIPAVSSNSVRIFAIANLNTVNQLSNNEEILNKLHSVTNAGELDELVADLDMIDDATETDPANAKKALVDRLQGSLISSGHYSTSADSPYAKEELFVLEKDGNTDALIIKNQSTGGAANGSIRLHHLDARFNFVVKLADGLPSGAYFKLKSWKVKNLHLRSFVHWQEVVSGSGFEHGATAEMNGNYIDETISADKATNSFTFYAFENRHDSDIPFTNVNAVKDAMEAEGFPLQNGSGFTADQAYMLREKKTVSGSFKYAPANAAYVILKGEYYNPKEKLDGGITQQCSATVTYIIHLGYIGEGNMETAAGNSSQEEKELAKLNDYRILRNSNYTYTVTVGGVNNIRVEADNKGENQPAAEGSVVDSDFDFQADAHYEQRYIQLDLRSIAERLKGADYTYMVNTPFTSGPVLVTVQADGSSDRPVTFDDKWVRFAYLGNDAFGSITGTQRSRIEEGAGYGLPYTYTYDVDPSESSAGNPVQLWSPVSLLQHLRSWINIYNTAINNGSPVEGDSSDPYIVLADGSYFYLLRYFTVYVDEYYYTRNPVTGTTSNTLWTSFCNANDRTMSIFQGVYDSRDGHSHHIRSGLNIRQRSIQTQYSTGQSGQQLANMAYGIEHTDEYGTNYDITLDYPMLSASSTSADGLDNTCRGLFDNRSLVTHVMGEFSWKAANAIFPLSARTSNDGEGLPLQQGSRCINVAALSRNRDNNRNGQIDLDEIVWYVLSEEQMVHLYVSSFLMEDPLYQVRLQKGDNLCYASSTFDISKGLAIQVADKGPVVAWMKEGDTSVSETDRKNCYVRCARNLGTPPVMQLTKPYTGTNYAHEGFASISPEPGSADVNYTFTYNKLNTGALRSYIGVGALGSHTLFQAAARPYRSFITAKQLFYAEGNSPVDWDRARNICNSYSELTDRSDKGIWRLPNSSEAMAMLFKFFTADNLWDNASGRVMWSCTLGGTSSGEYIGVDHSKKEMVCVPGANPVGYVRCVRDNRGE